MSQTPTSDLGPAVADAASADGTAAGGAVEAADPALVAAQSMVPNWVRGNSDLFAMLVTAVAVGLALFLVAWLAPVLAPLGLGLFIAAITAPLYDWLKVRGRSAGVALALTLVLLVAVGGAIAWLLLASAQALSESLLTYADGLTARYGEIATQTGTTGPVATLRDLIPPEVLVGVLQVVVQVVVQVGGTVVFGVVIAALLLLDASRLTGLVAGGLGSGNPVFRETPALARAAVIYVLMRIRVNAVTAASLLVLMLLVGVDYAPLWAVGAFFLSFVPYLGLTLALVPPTILALAETGPLAAAAVVLGGIALNLLAENVLEPTLTGRALSLATWLVFAMFFFWTWLLGPVGALLSMPITVLLVLVLEHNERTRWVAALLGRRAAGDAQDAVP